MTPIAAYTGEIIVYDEKEINLLNIENNFFLILINLRFIDERSEL